MSALLEFFMFHVPVHRGTVCALFAQQTRHLTSIWTSVSRSDPLTFAPAIAGLILFPLMICVWIACIISENRENRSRSRSVNSIEYLFCQRQSLRIQVRNIDWINETLFGLKKYQNFVLDCFGIYFGISIVDLQSVEVLFLHSILYLDVGNLDYSRTHSNHGSAKTKLYSQCCRYRTYTEQYLNWWAKLTLLQ